MPTLSSVGLVLVRMSRSLLNKCVVFQVSLRDIKEQFNGVIIAGHDLTIRILNAYRRFLLWRLPVRTLDVS
jgi:hypothetical protein